MLKYTVKRVLQALIVLWGVYTLTFLVVHMVPGDPVQIMMSKRADPAMMERIREQLGLNRPILAQYVSYLGRALQGELGQSYIKGVPVTQLIGTGFKTTAFVGLTAYGLAILIGLPIGMLAAEHRGRLADRMSIVFSMMMMSVPGFWLAVLLQILFGLKLEWFPISGMERDFWWVLPVLTLAIAYSASLARMTRTNVLDVLSQDYVRTARAKGLRPRQVKLIHVMKNVAIPTVTLFGLQLPSLLGGAMILEKIFSLKGVGAVAIEAITNRDYPVILGSVLYTATIFVVINLTVDLLYGLLDPRIRITGRSDAGSCLIRSSGETRYSMRPDARQWKRAAFIATPCGACAGTPWR